MGSALTLGIAPALVQGGHGVAHHARSLLHEGRRRLLAARGRRCSAYRVCDADSGAVAYLAAAGVVRLRRRTRPRIRGAVRHGPRRDGCSIRRMSETAFSDTSKRSRIASRPRHITRRPLTGHQASTSPRKVTICRRSARKGFPFRAANYSRLPRPPAPRPSARSHCSSVGMDAAQCAALSLGFLPVTRPFIGTTGR
jgi:hypothetical protein